MHTFHCKDCDSNCEVNHKSQIKLCYICDGNLCKYHSVKCKYCETSYCQNCLDNKHTCFNIDIFINKNIKENNIFNAKVKKKSKKKILITDYFTKKEI